MSRSKIKHRYHKNSRRLNLESLEPRLALTGTWTALTHTAPASINNSAMMLLSDGTVMVQGGSNNNWYKLAPDATGSYVNGNWSQLTSMSLGRSAFASNVLPDGRVFVIGGEYSGPSGARSDTNTGEIFNPLTNTWTSIASYPAASYGDGSTMVLGDGRVLAGDKYGAETSIYDPATNTWSAPIPKLWSDINDEETWVKLPDGSVFAKSFHSVNPPSGGVGVAQRFDPSTMSWVDSGRNPVALQTDGEMGPGLLLPDGRVFQIGANGNTAFYTPPTPGDGTNGQGSWAPGPTIPGGLGGDDSPAAMMPNGHVLLAAGATPGGGSPTKIFEFDPTAPISNSLTDVTPTTPDLTGTAVWPTRMLMLPSGQVLFAYGSNQLYVYTPDGAPDPAWKPTITGVVANGNHYTLSGTQLNGLSAGANYGDDAEMDSNYPLVKLTGGSGQVYFARTSNWSSTGVQTGSLPVSTDFSLPTNMPYGTYSLSVVTNGIASDSVPFAGGFTGTSADLAITYSAPSAYEGNNVYKVNVTNNGPTSATGVVLTDTLGANLNYVSATTSQGTFTRSGSALTFTIGSLAVGQSATATITTQTPEETTVTDTASVTSSVADMNPANNSVVINTCVAEAPIYVSGNIPVSGKKPTNQVVATFTHGANTEPASVFSATIDWGDGTTSAGTITLSKGTYSVSGSHVYATGGTHWVTTSVVENETSPSFAASAAITSTTTADSSSSSSTSSTQTAPADPPRLIPAAVDQSLLAAIDSVPQHARHSPPDAADEAALDELFALV